MIIEMKLNAGRCTLSINGHTAEMSTPEHVEAGWKVIKAALFAKHKAYSIQQILRKAS